MLINVGPFWPPTIKSLATALVVQYFSKKEVDECLERDERRGRERLAVPRRHCTTRTPRGLQRRSWQRCRTRLCWRLRWWPLRWAAPGVREAAHSNFARMQHKHCTSIVDATLQVHIARIEFRSIFQAGRERPRSGHETGRTTNRAGSRVPHAERVLTRAAAVS